MERIQSQPHEPGAAGNEGGETGQSDPEHVGAQIGEVRAETFLKIGQVTVEVSLQRRQGIAASLAMSLAMVAVATAQQPSPTATPRTDAQGNALPGQEASAERVIVTGSNIPAAAEVGPNPVDTYSRESIVKSGRP